jgi:hypothetical protein
VCVCCLSYTCHSAHILHCFYNGVRYVKVVMNFPLMQFSAARVIADYNGLGVEERFKTRLADLNSALGVCVFSVV